ncbi:hypothetical protein LshimejAT787_0705490 [Lyophyllum shimeji]|uniref:Uncharacterized protein n=1 Tax=Lyophyllum shimeji TaxID=47721 RepID=A0A9P3PR37_LYOSH|nr:hypothetical protein LshimejAT787_0705490 [Lyophyllum shimeji]
MIGEIESPQRHTTDPLLPETGACGSLGAVVLAMQTEARMPISLSRWCRPRPALAVKLILAFLSCVPSK